MSLGLALVVQQGLDTSVPFLFSVALFGKRYDYRGVVQRHLQLCGPLRLCFWATTILRFAIAPRYALPSSREIFMLTLLPLSVYVALLLLGTCQRQISCVVERLDLGLVMLRVIYSTRTSIQQCQPSYAMGPADDSFLAGLLYNIGPCLSIQVEHSCDCIADEDSFQASLFPHGIEFIRYVNCRSKLRWYQQNVSRSFDSGVIEQKMKDPSGC